MGRQAMRDFRHGMSSLDPRPVTTFIVGANVLTFLVTFFAQRWLFGWATFAAPAFFGQPWAILTYPLVFPSSIINLLLTGYVLWWCGTSLERQWRSLEFGLFFALVTVLTALFLGFGSSLIGAPYPLAGPFLPLEATFIAWCMLNPDATILLMFVLPIKARWLGYASLAIGYFMLGPVVGLFGLVTPLLAWWYVARGRRRFRLGVSTPRLGGSSIDWSPLLHPIQWLQRRKRRRDFDRLSRKWGLHDEDDLGGPH